MQTRWWQEDNRELIKRYFRIFRPYRRTCRPLVYRAALGTAVTVIIGLVLPWVTMKAIDHIINTKEISTLVHLLGFWAAAIFLRAGGGYLSFYNLMVFRQRMVINGQLKLLKHILRLPVSYFSKVNIGYVVCRVRDDIAQLHPFWAGTHITIVQSIVTVIVSAILLFTISGRLTAVLLILSPFYLFPSFLWLKRIHDLSYQAREQAGVAEGKLHEAISGGSVIKTLNLEAFSARNYFSRFRKAVKTNVRLEVISQVKSSLGGILRSLVPIVLFSYAGYLIYQGRLTVGEFVGFSVYVSFLLNPLSNLFGINTQLQRALAPLRRVFEIMDMEREDTAVDDTAAGSQLQGDIVFDDVTFSYGNGKPAVANLDVQIHKRSIVGICGISGAGKSTFVNLLVRLYQPDSGSLFFDGIKAADLPMSVIRRSIGIVTQDIFLFNDTIFNNLTCGLHRVNREQVEAATRMAGAHEFILGLSDGYDTMAGVRGLKMSGGERARLSIARALIRDPSILVFDEATAYMDSKTERIFRDATSTLFRNKTVLIISHRISSIRRADQILVFEGGNITQRGTHAELAAVPGLYQRLCHEQIGQEDATDTTSDREAAATASGPDAYRQD